MNAGLDSLLVETNRQYITPENFVTTYEQAMSKVMSVHLIVQTVLERVLYVHRRAPAVITRLLKVALWLLVVANSMFAFLGLAIAFIECKAASPRIHQPQIRLSTPGLAAQLFTSLYARREAKNDFQLFQQENNSVLGTDITRVHIRPTSFGGAEFVANDARTKVDLPDKAETLRLRVTHTL